ncbi:leukocyte immunoglobulin-like receptor subfamily A member 5 isoform X1 [Ovis aries]|uniref:leukocyte immunoglobulin-like receptor subfamily A member 5 isoform X1 n=1 Tax=Ovis aries TaxID=9940 RepID=UPI001C2E40E4|nr:leukocyte immunoglobulin-like receptor subfamily A member 5 isoform X1 [Ovis aries]
MMNVFLRANTSPRGSRGKEDADCLCTQEWGHSLTSWRAVSLTGPFSISEATAEPECGIMSMVFPSLLCLGLCLSQSTWAQKGNLTPPRITALPGSTVPPKSHVTLLCQGPGQAEGYKISKVGSPEPTEEEEQITPRKTNTLRIAEMTMDKAGLYHCSYQRGGRWSQFSDPLQLVMTGAYEKPSLSSVAGTVAAPGQNVKLQCFSRINHDVFILTKDGDHITQNQSSTPQDRGRQTIFLLSPVSSTQAGTYRCYGAFRDNPYVWSQPSDPLQLQVEGTTESPSSTQHRRSTGCPTNKHGASLRGPVLRLCSHIRRPGLRLWSGNWIPPAAARSSPPANEDPVGHS